MLMGTLYINEKLKVVKYTLQDHHSKERYDKFHKMISEWEGQGNRFEDQEEFEKFMVHVAETMEDHHLEIKCWHYIVFPVWIWKTFIHAKHEAFRFKYDSESLIDLEKH